MIAISAEEKKIIAEKYPETHMRRTVKQKSNRGHYYCEESRNVMNLLRKLRAVPREGGKGGRDQKKTGGN